MPEARAAASDYPGVHNSYITRHFFVFFLTIYSVLETPAAII